MEHKWYAIIFIIFVIAIVVFGGFVYFSVTFSPASIDLEECKTLKNDGGNINIVIFGDKKSAEKYMNYFFNFKPFNSLKEKFNFFYIDNYIPECEIYKGIAILCYSKELIRKAASCPADYIIVLNDAESSLRSSSYVNLISLNINHPLSVFAHEFGHAFANFAEEYVPAKIPRGALNCVKQCSEFGGIENGCYEGCSQQDYIRSIDNGVMRTLKSEDYGKFDESILEDRIKEYGDSSILTGAVIQGIKDCTKEKYYLIEGNYAHGEIRINKKSIETGCVGTNGYGDLKFDVLLEDGSKVDNGKFNAEWVFTSAPGEDMVDGEVFENEGKFYLKIPVIENSRELEIKDINEIILAEASLYDIGRRLCLIENG